MYCIQCGHELPKEAKFCPNCGKSTSEPTSASEATGSFGIYIATAGITIKNAAKWLKKKICDLLTRGADALRHANKKKLGKIAFICTGALIILISAIIILAVNATRIAGTYTCLTSDKTYILKQTSKNSGTFEMYKDGVLVGDENIRYTKTWTRNGDVLTLTYDDDTVYYFFIADNALIAIDNESDEPTYSDYIAPRGDTFNYEIGAYEFFSDGTLVWHPKDYYYADGSYYYADGSYYKDGNIIYCQENHSEALKDYYGSGNIYFSDEYTGDDWEAVFWIYNKDCITGASKVFVKE